MEAFGGFRSLFFSLEIWGSLSRSSFESLVVRVLGLHM